MGCGDSKVAKTDDVLLTVDQTKEKQERATQREKVVEVKQKVFDKLLSEGNISEETTVMFKEVSQKGVEFGRPSVVGVVLVVLV